MEAVDWVFFCIYNFGRAIFSNLDEIYKFGKKFQNWMEVRAIFSIG